MLKIAHAPFFFRAGLWAAAVAGILLSSADRAHASPRWPEAPVRRGSYLPEERDIAMLLEAYGMGMPASRANGPGRAALLDAVLTWNTRIVAGLGLFGQHTLSNMWWDNLRLLAFGHEVGARYAFGEKFAVHAAYLGHRTEYQWVDGHPFSLGGVHDHGAEVGGAGCAELLGRLRAEAHVLGRAFGEPDDKGMSRSYTDNQFVLGLGTRISLLVLRSHALIIELEELAVRRSHPRAGVDRVTWNTLGGVAWRWAITARLGLQLKVKASTSLRSGEVPMLELKRSAVNEPLGSVGLGLFAVF